MTSGIDPITGLDTAITDPYLYQIPLTTNPIQAPEWGWRGRVDQVLYPDYIPSVFATAQGYDESNPGAAQAHHMDGDGNLYVNVRKNEAGGGPSGGIPIKPLITSINNAEELGPGGSNNFQLSKRPTLLYQFECHVVLTDPAAADRGYFQVAFIGVDTDIYFTMGVAAIPPANHVPAGFTVSTNINREWAGGLDLSAIYADDSAVKVNAFSINCNFWGYWSCDYEGV